MKSKATQYQISYWIRRARKSGFHVDTALREIDPYPYKSFQDIPVGVRYYIGLLIKQGFNVQYKIR